MCLRYADMEKKLGEIDRARAIYIHCSQMCDPKSSPRFWQTWKEFETLHGNEDTIREMLRIKRSVQATYNVQVNFMSAQMIAASLNSKDSSIAAAAAASAQDDQATKENGPMASLEAKAAALAKKSILTNSNNKERETIKFIK